MEAAPGLEPGMTDLQSVAARHEGPEPPEVMAFLHSCLSLSLSQARDLTTAWEGADSYAQVWGRADRVSRRLSGAVYAAVLEGAA